MQEISINKANPQNALEGKLQYEEVNHTPQTLHIYEEI